MPVIKDIRIFRGKQNRNRAIREYFSMRFNGDNIRYDVIVEEIIARWGLSESTINQILKEYGGYQNDDNERKV
jgi:hypothetical protein